MTKTLDEIDVFRELQKQCRTAGGQQAWAEKHGLSSSYVCDVLNSRRGFGPSILAAMGFKKVTRYERIAK